MIKLTQEAQGIQNEKKELEQLVIKAAKNLKKKKTQFKDEKTKNEELEQKVKDLQNEMKVIEE